MGRISDVRVKGFKDVPDPKPLDSDRGLFGSLLEKQPIDGSLFGDGISAFDPHQGALHNCGMPGALSALAKVAPDRIKRAFQASQGHLTVRFIDHRTQKITMQPVDSDFYLSSTGTLAYGRAAKNPKLSHGVKLWYPLVEKAFAARKGTYQGLLSNPSEVLSQLLGLEPRVEAVASDGRNILERYDTFFADSDPPQRLPIVLVTDHHSERYTGTGLVPHHAYALLHIGPDRHGVLSLHLRNTWGNTEPSGDGKDDGVFTLPLADAPRFFVGLHTVYPGPSPRSQPKR